MLHRPRKRIGWRRWSWEARLLPLSIEELVERNRALERSSASVKRWRSGRNGGAVIRQTAPLDRRTSRRLLADLSGRLEPYRRSATRSMTQRAAAASELKPTNILLSPFSAISSTQNFLPRGTIRNVFIPPIWQRSVDRRNQASASTERLPPVESTGRIKVRASGDFGRNGAR